MAIPAPKHILIYEPRTEGHHLVWLRMIAGDFLKAGIKVTIALDLREEIITKVKEQVGEILYKGDTIAVRDVAGKLIGGTHLKTLVNLFNKISPDQIFLCELDEIASSISRRAAFELLPPAVLRGKIGGIYFRPRFFEESAKRSLNNALKRRGFNKLAAAGWFRQILLVDEYLFETVKRAYPGYPVYLLPDPVPEHYEGDAKAARRTLGMPLDKTVFLFYGGAYRRKGLHLVVEAFLKNKLPGAFLYCAGLREDNAEIEKGIEQLVGEDRALSLKKYITKEEVLLFRAADFVLLPYIRHFGASSVLSGAVSAKKPVIVSDEELLGKMVRSYNLGITFESENSAALANAIKQALESGDKEKLVWKEGAEKFERNYSRERFRKTLVESVNQNG